MTKVFSNSLIRAISDQKLADINQINRQVQIAQYEVAQKQSIVTSLLAKSNQFQGYLTEAQSNQATALANFNLVTQAMGSVTDLAAATLLARDKVDQASEGMSGVARDTASLVNELIFTVEVIDKLTQYVNKQKSMNPLIPDTLVAFLGKAATDANDAIALSLTALQSSYSAEATLLESETTIQTGFEQANALAGKAPSCGCNAYSTPVGGDMSKLTALLEKANKAATSNYNSALNNNAIVTKQLAYAQSELAKAQTRLNSVQAGLAAANAAAYAA